MQFKGRNVSFVCLFCFRVSLRFSGQYLVYLASRSLCNAWALILKKDDADVYFLRLIWLQMQER